MARRHKIDTHSHIVPDFYAEALTKTGHGKPDGMPGVPVNYLYIYLSEVLADTVIRYGPKKRICR